MLILSLQHIPKAKDTRFLKVTKILKFEAETKSLRPRPKGPEAEAEAKILASRPVQPRCFNISGSRHGKSCSYRQQNFNYFNPPASPMSRTSATATTVSATTTTISVHQFCGDLEKFLLPNVALRYSTLEVFLSFNVSALYKSTFSLVYCYINFRF